jgi:hypothetical protein
MTDDVFAAEASPIPVDASSNLLSVPLELALFLSAENGQENEEVGPTFIQGRSSLITTVPSMPHLSSTNRGVFLLQKPPLQPSTNQVELVTVP